MVKITSISVMEIRMLEFLLANTTSRFSIREISRRAKIDYKLVHSTIKKLEARGVVKQERVANAILCSIDLGGDLSSVYYVESLRAKNFLAKNSDVRALVEGALHRIPRLYFSLVIFGSFAKGAQTKTSDLDLLIISPNQEVGEEIARIIHGESMHLRFRVHPIIVGEKEFIDNLKDKRTNVITEAFRNHIIIEGLEGFYNGVKKVA